MDYIRALTHTCTHAHTRVMTSVCRPIPSDHTVTSLINQSTHEEEINKNSHDTRLHRCTDVKQQQKVDTYQALQHH